MPAWHRRIDAGSSLVGDGYRTRSHQTGGKRTHGDHCQKVIITLGELAHAERPGRTARSSGRRRAAGIYGTIITAAVIAATGVRLTTLALVVSVLVTLLVYWVAEEYAARVGGKRLFVITSMAAALGLMMIVLKDVVLIHLH
jgi:hypothetical protein